MSGRDQPAAKPASRIDKNFVRKQQYLTIYNLVSAVAWLAILLRVCIILPIAGHRNVYAGVGEFTKWTQTGATLEILHSATGLVRSPLATTFIQVLSRLIIVWPIVGGQPFATTPSPFYSSMLLAWSVTEVARYGYFVQTLRGTNPGPLAWFRYNGFFVLYPVGITSEMMMVWRASSEMPPLGQYIAYGILLTYIPGSYIMYTHMMKQRRKMIKGKAPERRKRVDTLQGNQ